MSNRGFPTLNRIGDIPIDGLPTAILNTLQFDSVNYKMIWVAGGGSSVDTWDEHFGNRVAPPAASNTSFCQPGGLVLTTLASQFENIISRSQRLIGIRSHADTWGATTGTLTISIRKNGSPEGASDIVYLPNVNPQSISATGLSVDFEPGDDYIIQLTASATLNGTNRISNITLTWETL